MLGQGLKALENEDGWQDCHACFGKFMRSS